MKKRLSKCQYCRMLKNRAIPGRLLTKKDRQRSCPPESKQSLPVLQSPTKGSLNLTVLLFCLLFSVNVIRHFFALCKSIQQRRLKMDAGIEAGLRSLDCYLSKCLVSSWLKPEVVIRMVGK